MAAILVVDDEPGIRSFLADTLESEDHEVDQADSGQAALECLASRGYELVVTDLKMPGLDGMGLLSRMRELDHDSEVIVLTAHGTVDTAVEAMKLGAFDFLEKPISSPAALRLIASRAIERYRARVTREGLIQTGGPQLSYGAPAMEGVVAALRKVAVTDATVLLLGESGTGKEVAARAIHSSSPRASSPFMAINCAALSENLLESELFGHEKGAFTGATTRRRGRLEVAEGGTFFLDEVGDLDHGLQAKLLRVLQERRFERLGGNQTLRCDVRWVAATNRDLESMIDDGTFREDLYHRLAVFPVSLPPLRDRREDIPELARTLLRGIARDLKRPGLELDRDAVSRLSSLPWRGNVRELANTLERAAILNDGERVGVEHLPVTGKPAAGKQSSQGVGSTLAEAEKSLILQTLEALEGNRKLTAEALGIGLRTLYDKLKKFDIS